MQYRLDETAFTTLSEDIQKEYTKADDGTFRLKLEGDGNPAARLDEFRDTNRTLQAQLEAYGDITPDSHKELQTKLQELEAQNQSAPDKLEAAIGSAVTPLQKQILQLKEEIKLRDEAVATERRRGYFKDLVTTAGARPDAIRYIVNDLEAAGFKDVGGKYVATGGTTPEEILASLRVKKQFMFLETKGAGSGEPSASELRNSKLAEMDDKELGAHFLK